MSLHPKQAVLQVVNYCNITCTMCPVAHAPMHRMSPSVAQACIDAIKDYPSIQKVEFSGGIGEPTLHKQLPGFIRYAKSSGHQNVGLITNGTTLSKVAEELVDSQPDYIIISLYGSDAEHHAKYQSSSFSLVEEGVHHLLETRKQAKSNTVVVLRYSPLDPGDPDLLAFNRKWEPFPVLVSSRLLHNALDGVVESHYSNNSNCRSPTNQVVFDVAGNVVSCCINSEHIKRFSNLSASNLISIYEGEEFQQWRLNRLNLECVGCSGQDQPND